MRENTDGVTELRERYTRIGLPQGFDRDHVAQMQKDLEFLTRIARQYPDEVLALHNRILELDYRGARELARSIGLTEEAIRSEGGGKWGVVIVIAVLAAVLLEHD